MTIVLKYRILFVHYSCLYLSRRANKISFKQEFYFRKWTLYKKHNYFHDITAEYLNVFFFAGNFSIREKRQAMDMMNKGTELGAEIGMLVDGPLGAAVGGAVGFVVSGILCIFICKNEGIIFI